MSERDRRGLHKRAAELLGEQDADVLMELLPQAGWSELVTKADLHLELARLRAELTADLHRELSAIHAGMVRQTWIFVGSMLAGLGALGGLLH